MFDPLGGRTNAAAEDLEALAERSYIRTKNHNMDGSFEFTLTESGVVIAGQDSDTFVAVEAEALGALDGDGFRKRHPAAYEKWQHAARLAADDPVENATRIGHDCREAMQLFGSSIVAVAAIDVTAGPTQTVTKVRAVLNARCEVLSEKVIAALDALLVLWGTTADLTQRQEHGAQKDGDPLEAADARRVVLLTAVVMSEVDAAVTR